MAARLNRMHQDSVRAKIQAGQLIYLLAEHAHGNREMSSTQIQAAKILLDKSVSNAPQDVNNSLSGGITIQVTTGVNTNQD
jgi:hypothetical protein